MLRVLTFALLALLVAAPTLAQNPVLPNTAVITFQDGTTAAGNGNVLGVQNMQVLGVQVTKTGTYAGTVSPEGAVAGSSTWSAITCYPTGSSTASTTPNAGIFRCNTLGVNRVRMRASSVTPGTGTLTIYGFATSLGPLPVDVP